MCEKSGIPNVEGERGDRWKNAGARVGPCGQSTAGGFAAGNDSGGVNAAVC